MKRTLIGPGLHSLAFVVSPPPILAGANDRRMMDRTRLAEQSPRCWGWLATGLDMVATGAIILGWFV